MSDAQDITIEQLHYVQFFEGNYREFKLRAASPTLRRNEERIKALKPYALYMLPPGTESLTSVGRLEAPTSLAFIRTEQGGRILVQKVYDNVPRPPHVNIHMLVGFDSGFSLKEAITLWGSSFWRSEEAKPMIEGDLLNPLSLNGLKRQDIDPFLNRSLPSILLRDREQAKTYLPFVIQCYLLRRAIVEHSGLAQGAPRILIIAPAAQVAYLISALSRLLPRQLLLDVTFSTYEHDVLDQKYHLCGTCLLPRQDRDIRLLGSIPYTTNFVLNTYTQDTQQYIPPAFHLDISKEVSHYADFAVKAFGSDYVDYKLRTFLKQMESFSQLNIGAFLEQYHKAFGGLGPTMYSGGHLQQSHLSKEVVEELAPTETIPRKASEPIQPEGRDANHPEGLSHGRSAAKGTGSETPQSLSSEIQYENTAPDRTKSVSQKDVENAFKSSKRIEALLRHDSDRSWMIEMLLANPAWFQDSQHPYLLRLQEAISKQPKQLTSLIEDVSARAIKAIRAGDENNIQEVLSVLSHILPPISGSSLWRDLLTELVEKEQYNGFVQHHWLAGEQLLTIAKYVLQLGNEQDNLLLESLLRVEPSDFGKLLALLLPRGSTSDETGQLRFPAEWSYLVIQRFINTPSTQLTPNTIQYFEQHHEIVGMLFKELSDQNKWPVLTQFLDKLVDSGYQRDLLFHCFEARPSRQGAELLAARLDEKEREKLFQKYEALCIELFPSSAQFRAITRRYLPTFPLTWDRIHSLKFMLDKLKEAEINTLAVEIAEMLDTCIDSPIRLGMLFSSLVRLKAGAGRLLADMAQHVKDEFVRVTVAEEGGGIAQDDVSRIRSRFSAYVQFALRVDATYDSSQAGGQFGVDLLNRLLYGADEKVFAFINNEVQYWPAELSREWVRVMERYRPPLKEVVVASSPSLGNGGVHTLPAATTSPPKPEVPATLPASVEETEALDREETKILTSLDELAEKRNARELAAFWLENYVVLTLIGRGPIGQDKWDQMRIAYNFCDACKKAKNAPKNSQGSMEAELAIVEASEESHNRDDCLHFTRMESWRIKRAYKRSQATSSNPT